MLTIISTKFPTQSVQRKLCTTENPENIAEKQFVFYRRGGTACLANGSGVDVESESLLCCKPSKIKPNITKMCARKYHS